MLRVSFIVTDLPYTMQRNRSGHLFKTLHHTVVSNTRIFARTHYKSKALRIPFTKVANRIAFAINNKNNRMVNCSASI